MHSLSLSFAFLLLAMAPVGAQTPAQPADPQQGRPAQPVIPNSLTPPELEAPTTPAPTSTATPTAPTPLSLLADSSLKKVLQELAQNWADAQDPAPQVALTLTNAATLRSRVEANSGADVIIGADVADMKALADKGLLFPDSQRSLARNTLVIYGRKALVKDDDLDWFDLTGTEWKKVALGNPDLTASGRVAQHALQKHGLINDDNKDVFTHVPTEARALASAESEQADAVFIYKTDLPQPDLSGFTLYPLKTDDAPPIFYIAAVPRLSKNPALARAFIDYCSSEPAKAIWTKYGFETN
jgi:molybdate transport system substrate-binding protein